MSKRMFEILDEMNLDDVKDNTRLVRISNSLISAAKIKQGAKISIGVEEKVLYDLMNEKIIPVLILVDKEEYFKRKGPEKVCKGSMRFGTGCGKCKRCKRELEHM